MHHNIPCNKIFSTIKHPLLCNNSAVLGGRDTFGRYECRALNDLGEASQALEVGGLADPAVFVTDGTAAAADPHGHTLTWRVRSLEPLIEFRLDYQGQDHCLYRIQVCQP
jgi:hypothetical protein